MLILSLLLACTSTGSDFPEGTLGVDVWADNWFAMYVDGELVGEDSVPITTERSFNQESFSFEATAPYQIAVIAKDFKEDDSGLEYIGEANQQMGDGGLILQVTDAGALVAATDAAWRCLVIHKAPLDTSCEDDTNPSEMCTAQIDDEPEGWKTADYDDSAWDLATEYSENDVGAKDGYNDVKWDSAAKLIWTSSLTQDNTLLCRWTVD